MERTDDHDQRTMARTAGGGDRGGAGAHGGAGRARPGAAGVAGVPGAPRPGAAADDPTLPDTWSRTENVAWSVGIPGLGWSSPVVAGDHVFVTSAISAGAEREPVPGLYDPGAEFGKQRSTAGHRWMVYDVSFATGRIRWARELASRAPPELKHVKNSFASETPVTDGRRVAPGSHAPRAATPRAGTPDAGGQLAPFHRSGPIRPRRHPPRRACDSTTGRSISARPIGATTSRRRPPATAASPPPQRSAMPRA